MLLLTRLLTKAQCNVASCWVSDMAEVAHTNLEHKHTKSCTASVKCMTLPPYRGVSVSLLFCLATKQNLEWPTFIPTPIPPPLAFTHTHLYITQLIHWDWMGFGSVKWIVQSQDTHPCADVGFLSECKERLLVVKSHTQRTFQLKNIQKKRLYPTRTCV